MTHRRVSVVLDVLLACALIATAWRIFGTRVTRAAAAAPIQPGARLDLPAVRWAAGSRNVVLAMRTECHACQLGIGFYRTMAEQLRGRAGEKLYVVSGEAKATVQAWLRKQEIPVPDDQVLQAANPVALGLPMTPMLLLVDRTGTVTDVMAGSLSDGDKRRWLERVEARSSVPMNNIVPDPEVSERDLGRLLPDAAVVDLRERTEFEEGHRPGALNIPFDELSARAPVELPSDRTAVLICPAGPPAKCRDAAATMRSLGFRVNLLRP